MEKPADLTSSPFLIRKHPHLYEINTWAWLEALSQKQGHEIRLRDVPDKEWDALQELGFDLVWLMGVWQRSPESQRIARTEASLFSGYDRALPGWKQEDVIGSPYAVRSYEPDPRIGNWEDLRFIRKKLHQRGIGLILDFVPNHTARDHPWIETDPNLYIQGTPQSFVQSPDHFFQPRPSDHDPFIAYGKDPYFPPWTDTAQLNYYNPETRAAMLGELKTIAEYCDGVRCDMAMLILNRILSQTWGDMLQQFPVPPQEFWSEVREALPHFLLIGEVYWDLEWELQQLGFDFAYDKRLYDRLRRDDAQGLRDHLTAALSYQNKLVRFLENHDEPRSAETFGLERLPAALTLQSTLPGMRLYHQGQLEGKRLHLPVQLRHSKPEIAGPQIHDWHDIILKITNTPIFHDGEWQLLSVHAHQDDTYRHLIGYSWQLECEVRLVIVNLSSSPAQGQIILYRPLPGRAQDETPYVLEDLLGGNQISFTKQDIIENGMIVEVKPFKGHIFSFPIT